MELKPGYKQTEVGVIPEDWEIQTLGNLTDAQRPISYGIVQTGPSTPNGVKCLRVVDIEDGQINKNNLITTTQTISNAYKRTILRAGDLVMPLRGKVGDVALVNEDLAGSNLTRGLALIAIRTDKCALFFKQLISSISIRNRLERSMNGSALQEIPIATIRTFKVAFPSAHLEQTAIANALSDADALIQSLTTLIAKKRQIKQGAMQTLLNPYENGRLKEGWHESPLREVSYMKGRIGWQGLKQTEFTMNEEEPFLITGMNFKDGEISWNEVYHISYERYEIAKDIQLKPNDVLMTKDGTIGKLLYVNEIPYPGKASLNSHLLVFRPIRNSYDPKFLYYQLLSKVFRDYIEISKSGSTFFGLSQEAVGNYLFKFPKLQDQTRIATILSNMDAEIAALEAKLAKYQHIKQGMMQNLLTGRIRLI